MQNYLLLFIGVLVLGVVLYIVIRKWPSKKIQSTKGESVEEEIFEQKLPWDIEVIERNQAVVHSGQEDLILTDELKSYVSYIINSAPNAGKIITKENYKVRCQVPKQLNREQMATIIVRAFDFRYDSKKPDHMK